MKLNKTLLVVTLSLLAATGLMAKSQLKEEIPGVAAQPSSYFYTGKPYDADLGAYTFNYRTYDPELKRWTTADLSGFPDGANCARYVLNPVQQFDPLGLSAMNISRTTTWTQDYTVNAPPTANTDIAQALVNLACSSAPTGFSLAANTVQLIGLLVDTSHLTYDPGAPNTNSNFTASGPQEQDVGDWTPFGPEGHIVVQSYDPKRWSKVTYVERFDYENHLYPYATVVYGFVESMSIE